MKARPETGAYHAEDTLVVRVCTRDPRFRFAFARRGGLKWKAWGLWNDLSDSIDFLASNKIIDIYVLLILDVVYQKVFYAAHTNHAPQLVPKSVFFPSQPKKACENDRTPRCAKRIEPAGARNGARKACKARGRDARSAQCAGRT